MHGDTDIIVTTFQEDGLPALEWALSREIDPDEDKTTTVDVRSGQNTPHTTIRFSPAKADANTYHVLWWCYAGGGEQYRTFTISKGDSSGYGLVKRILGVIDRHREGAK